MRKSCRTILAMCTIAATVLAWTGVGLTKAPERPPQPQSLQDGNLGQALVAADVDGDGTEELIATAPATRDGGTALIFRQFPPRGAGKPWLALAGGETFGWSAVGLGDLDRDGAAEFAVGALDDSGPIASLCGTVTVFRGGNPPRRSVALSGEYAFDRFGYALAAGDLNADGAKDLVIGAPFHSPSPALYQRGAVYVAFGPAYSQAALLKLPATAVNGGVGWSFAVGDINADGTDDLLMEATGKVLGFYGRAGFSPSLGTPDLSVTSAAGGFGRAIAVAGDLNGDGFGDIAIGAARAVAGGVAESGMVFLVKGGAGVRSINLGAPTPDLLAAVNGAPDGERFGTSLLALGDIDGDGRPDIAVGAAHADSGAHPMTGKVYVLSGKDASGADPRALAQPIERPAEDMHFGASLALGTGGVLFVGAPTENGNAGRVHRFRLR